MKLDSWPLESRRKTMREVVADLARQGWLGALKPHHAARTYGVTTAEVEAETMKHLSEGSDK